MKHRHREDVRPRRIGEADVFETDVAARRQRQRARIGRRRDVRLDAKDFEQPLRSAGRRETSPQTWLSWPSAAAANAAYSTNCPSRPGVIEPISTSCEPIHRITTTLVKMMKMMIAVRIARAWVERARRLIGLLDLVAEARHWRGVRW